MSRASLPPLPRDPRQPADFDPVTLGRELLRSARVGTLATLDPASGFPFATLVNVATDAQGAPLLLVSQLSAHTRNLLADARVSLLLSKSGQSARAEKGDPMAHPRLTVQAQATLIEDENERARARRRYLARHPKARLYADFPDFVFFRLVPGRVHLNGGFARAFEGDAAYLLSPLQDAAAFEALEVSALDHLNNDHPETLARYAEDLCGRAVAPGEAGRWQATGIDPHGLDLMRGDEAARLPFPQPVEDAATLARVLKALATSATTGEGV